jgi:hypothetical protein
VRSASNWSITSSGIRSPSGRLTIRLSLARSATSQTCLGQPGSVARARRGAGGSPDGSPPAPSRSRSVADAENFFSVVEGMTVAFTHADTNPRTVLRRPAQEVRFRTAAGVSSSRGDDQAVFGTGVAVQEVGLSSVNDAFSMYGGLK